MNNEILEIVREFIKLDETGKYTVSHNFSIGSNWLKFAIYKGRITAKKKPIFSDSINFDHRMWFNDFNQVTFHFQPFIDYLRQLRTASNPVLKFDPAKSAKHDAPVL